MTRHVNPTTPFRPAGPATEGAHVYMLRIWGGLPPRPGFRALVRPVGDERWLGFTSAEDLVAFLVRHDTFSKEDKP